MTGIKQSTQTVLLFLALFGFGGAGTYAAPAASGRQIADQRCAACHGAAGISGNDLIPNLQCQKRKYLIRQLQRFRIAGHGGKDTKHLTGRPDAIMDDVAKDLVYGDIVKLANFYAHEACE